MYSELGEDGNLNPINEHVSNFSLLFKFYCGSDELPAWAQAVEYTDTRKSNAIKVRLDHWIWIIVSFAQFLVTIVNCTTDYNEHVVICHGGDKIKVSYV